jgi:hypothetical protein
VSQSLWFQAYSRSGASLDAFYSALVDQAWMRFPQNLPSAAEHWLIGLSIARRISLLLWPPPVGTTSNLNSMPAHGVDSS